MLEESLINELKNVFLKLDDWIELEYFSSNHPEQKNLLDLLNDLQTSSAFIKLSEVRDLPESLVPKFYVNSKTLFRKISFEGLPMGHEFSSLVLAILNANQKGKFPDDGIRNRIKSLKGPITLKTYISLTCENCPEVVQTLNLFSVIHHEFSHQMIDGQFYQKELEQKNILGVPSTMVDDELILSGKSDLLSILTQLEKHFGKDLDRTDVGKSDYAHSNLSSKEMNSHLGEFDLVVIGGGPAGVSSAIYGARKGLKTAILAERIGGQVKDTLGIENFIGTKYTEGPRLVQDLLNHAEEYPIKIFEHRRVQEFKKLNDSHSEQKYQTIELESGEIISGKYVIVATGAKWRNLGVPGEKELLGRGVHYCPHCDGPSYKGKNIVVVGGGNSGVEAALDLSSIAKSITVVEFNPILKADKVLVDKAKNSQNIKFLLNYEVKELRGESGKLESIILNDRALNKIHELPMDGVFVQIGLIPNSHFLKGLVEVNKFGEIIVDSKGRTSASRIYAAGDVTNIPFKQIIMAMGDGAKTALAVFEESLLE